MSTKYRKISCNLELNEKKSRKKSDEYRIPNNYNKQASSNRNIRKSKAQNINYNYENNQEEAVLTNRRNNSQQKRSRFDNKIDKIDNKKKGRANLSSDKRLLKRDQNKKNNENKNDTSILKKNIKSKKNIKDNIEELENSEIIRKRSNKSKTTLIKEEEISSYSKSNKYSNLGANKYKKIESYNQNKKDIKDEIKKKLENKKRKSSENIKNDLVNNTFSHNPKNLYNENDLINKIQTPRNKKFKTIKEVTTFKKKEKEKEKDIINEEDEKEIINKKKVKKKKKRNKTRSVGKETAKNKILLKDKLNSEKKDNIVNSESNSENDESSDSGTSSISSSSSNSSNSSKSSKNQNKTQVSKDIQTSNQKRLTVISQPQNTDIQKNDEDKNQQNPKIVSYKPNEEAGKNNVIPGKKYLKRRSMDNATLREKLEKMLDEQTLKQNGGNTLYLKNYEKGPVHLKEFEILVKNQNIKKKLKIGSCTKAGCSGPGIVKTNQDTFFIKENFLKNNNNIYMGVCDGHGIKGELVSNYVANKLHEYITGINNDSIINAFKKVNNEVYSNKNIESDMAGTTVVSLIMTSNKMICVNLGDSRAALFKNENGLYYCKNLNREHKPCEPDENRRIMLNNGRIKKCYDEDLKKYVGPDRVWLKTRDEPGLAMTRSIGDKVAHTVGVSDEPELKYFDYDGNEKFIVIASDGIWEYIHGDECIKIIKPYYEDNKDVEEAAYVLVKEAFRKWKRKEVAIDDITVIVVFFCD